MKRTFLFILMLTSPFVAKSKHSLVFIHLGNTVPSYIVHSVNQARSFNPTCPLFIITNGNINPLLKNLPKNIAVINPKDIPETNLHRQFREKTTLDKNSREGFWLHASERFLVLHDFIEQFQLKNVFHLENDTLLYANLEELLPLFEKNYPSVGAVFDNDDRCIPCFVYLASANSAKSIAECFTKNAQYGINDMQVMGLLKKQLKSPIIMLPIIMPSYIKKHGLKSPSGHTTNAPETFTKNIELFNSLFDAAALGQFLGGIDPRNGHSAPGFINESCLFNPSHLSYSWKKDSKGRNIPYMTFNNETYRINTLHIHSKNLAPFLSKQP